MARRLEIRVGMHEALRLTTRCGGHRCLQWLALRSSLSTSGNVDFGDDFAFGDLLSHRCISVTSQRPIQWPGRWSWVCWQSPFGRCPSHNRVGTAGLCGVDSSFRDDGLCAANAVIATRFSIASFVFYGDVLTLFAHNSIYDVCASTEPLVWLK